MDYSLRVVACLLVDWYYMCLVGLMTRSRYAVSQTMSDVLMTRSGHALS